jgi:hypothetical protein
VDADVTEEVKVWTRELKEKHGVIPGLAVSLSLLM